jgi:hypothetical protein
MKKTTAVVVTMAVCAVAIGHAANEIADKGTWPTTWPKELEPLRKQARTIRGSLVDLTTYEIPFTGRTDFESAWPCLLKVKSKGAPLVLLRGPNKSDGARINAGVRIQCPPPQAGKSATPAAPIPGTTRLRERWLWATYIELVVDGKIVDLNRIPLPADSPIIDMRFDDEMHKSLDGNSG